MAAPEAQFGNLGYQTQPSPAQYHPTYVNVPSQAGQILAEAGRTAQAGGAQLAGLIPYINPGAQAQYRLQAASAGVGQQALEYLQNYGKPGWQFNPAMERVLATGGVQGGQFGVQPGLNWQQYGTVYGPFSPNNPGNPPVPPTAPNTNPNAQPNTNPNPNSSVTPNGPGASDSNSHPALHPRTLNQPPTTMAAPPSSNMFAGPAGAPPVAGSTAYDPGAVQAQLAGTTIAGGAQPAQMSASAQPGPIPQTTQPPQPPQQPAGLPMGPVAPTPGAQQLAGQQGQMVNWLNQNAHPVASSQDALNWAKMFDTRTQSATYLPHGGPGGEPAFSFAGKGFQNTVPLSMMVKNGFQGSVAGQNTAATLHAAEQQQPGGPAGQQPPGQPPAQPGQPPQPAPSAAPAAPAGNLSLTAHPAQHPNGAASGSLPPLPGVPDEREFDSNGAPRAGHNSHHDLNVTGQDGVQEQTGVSSDQIEDMYNRVAGGYNAAAYQAALAPFTNVPSKGGTTAGKMAQATPGREGVQPIAMPASAAERAAQAALPQNAPHPYSPTNGFGMGFNDMYPNDPVFQPNANGYTWYVQNFGTRENPNYGEKYTQRAGSTYWSTQRLSQYGDGWREMAIPSQAQREALFRASGGTIPIENLNNPRNPNYWTDNQVTAKLKEYVDKQNFAATGNENADNGDFSSYDNMISATNRAINALKAIPANRLTHQALERNREAMEAGGTQSEGYPMSWWDNLRAIWETMWRGTPDLPAKYFADNIDELKRSIEGSSFSNASKGKMAQEIDLDQAMKSGNKDLAIQALTQFRDNRIHDMTGAGSAALLNWKRLPPRYLDQINAWNDRLADDKYGHVFKHNVWDDNDHYRPVGDYIVPRDSPDQLDLAPRHWQVQGGQYPQQGHQAPGGWIHGTGREEAAAPSAAGQPLQVDSIDHYQRLPVGTRYRDSRGNIAVKGGVQPAMA